MMDVMIGNRVETSMVTKGAIAAMICKTTTTIWPMTGSNELIMFETSGKSVEAREAIA